MSERKPVEELPTLSILLKIIKPEDEEILYYACESFNRHLEDENGKKELIQALIKGGICSQLLQLVVHPSTHLAVAAVHIVGCMTDIKDEAPLQAIINAGIIPHLVCLLEHGDYILKKEVSWAISRSLEGASYEQLRYLAEKGCLRACCGMLSFPELEVVSFCVTILSRILDMGKQLNLKVDGASPYLKTLKECGGIDRIKTLRDEASIAILALGEAARSEVVVLRDETDVILNHYFHDYHDVSSSSRS